MSKVWLSLARMGGNERQFVDEAFATNWVAPLGPNVDNFEKELSCWLKSQGAEGEIHNAALSSGTAAIHLALVMIGVGAGDEVICQDFTFVATANPIVYLGATPVFVDSEPGTWNMSPQLLEEAIRDRISKTGRCPKAIIPVYLYGNPPRMNEIMDVARRYGIPVIEDSAEAMGTIYDGKPAGTIGRYGVLSFNGNKMITTSGGGSVICHSEDEARRVRFYSTQAREPRPYYHHTVLGYNYRMSNVCAGIGRGQLLAVDGFLRHRRHLHDLYCQLFADIDGISVMTPQADMPSNPNYWLTCISINMTDLTWQKVQQALEKADIESRPMWKPMHMQPFFADCPAYINGVAEAQFMKGLALPSGPCVSDDDAHRIVSVIKSIIS